MPASSFPPPSISSIRNGKLIQLLLDHSEDALCLWDESGCLVGTSPLATVLFDRDEEVKTLLESRLEDLRQGASIRFSSGDREWMAGEEPCDLDGAFGSLVTLAPVPAEREPFLPTAVAQDDRIVSEAELRFQEMLERLRMIAVILDSSGNIAFCNNAFAVFSGWSRDELKGRSWFELFVPEDLREKMVDGRLEAVRRGLASMNGENRLVLRNGEERVVVWNTTILRNLQGLPVALVSIGEDITRRWKAESELRVLLRALEQSPTSIVITDTSGIIRYVNPRFEQTSGYGAEELIGKRPSVIKSGKMDPEVYAQLWNHISQGGEWRGELLNRRKNGELYWEAASISGIVDEQGIVTNYVGVKEDITDRKRRAEEEHARAQRIITYQKALLRLVQTETVFSPEDIRHITATVSETLGVSFVSLWLFDEDGGIDCYDGYDARSRQHESGAHISASDAPLYFETLRDSRVLAVQDVEQDARTHELWDLWLKPREIHSMMDVPLWLHGRLVGILCHEDDAFRAWTFEDQDFVMSVADLISVTMETQERRRAEGQIRMLAQAVRSIQECISVTDMQDNIIFVNKAFLETYGYDEEEILGQNIAVLRSVDGRNTSSDFILQETLKDGHWHGELVNRRKNGESFPIDLSTSVIHNETGHPIALIGVAVDITERKRAEQELIAARDKAQESDLLKDAFIANISHEIRTPLNVILGYSNLIAELFGRHASPEERLLFDSISRGGQRLMRTVEHILNISIIRSGTFEMFPETLDITEILSHVIDNFMPVAHEKRIALRLVNQMVHPMTHVDRFACEQAMMNILDNAVKFTTHGHVEVRTTNVDGRIRIDVEDTGIGISEEYLPKLFKVFSQEITGYTRPFDGLGLGLALTKHYIELNHGDIAVTSHKGQGTTFTVHFPAAPVEPVPPVPVSSMSFSLDTGFEKKEDLVKHRILVVEDDLETLAYMQLILGRTDTVHLATSEEEVFAVLDQHEVDIVLMDLALHEGEDGLHITRRLRCDDRYASMPIIAVTAHAFPEDRERSFSAGCNAFVAKPFSLPALRKVMDRCIREAHGS